MRRGTNSWLMGLWVVTLSACAGQAGPGSDSESAAADSPELSDNAYLIANRVIMDTRPQATELLVQELNMELANNNILSAVVSDVESRVLKPLSSGDPQNECPYLTKSSSANPLSCRFVVDKALEKALVNSAPMTDTIEQGVDSDHAAALPSDELAWVKQWVGEAVMSGIDVGAVHSVQVLRGQAVCDQAPSQTESAFKLGEEQGQAILEQAEANVLPEIPRTQCNTDVIANAIRAHAEEQVSAYVVEHPMCEGFAPADLAEAVDLGQAEETRVAGVLEGIRAAYEGLRVRLVSSWECVRPAPSGDPLVDLDGTGIEFTGQRAAFDLADTGEQVNIPVLTGGAALLAVDLDQNGRIDTGAELLSNAASCDGKRCVDGIEALRQHDANQDGRIDAQDSVFERLALWQDTNANGKSEGSELRSLASAGITAISTASRVDSAWTDDQGNSAIRSVQFEREDGSAGVVHDVWYGLSLDEMPKDLRSAGIVSSLRERLP